MAAQQQVATVTGAASGIGRAMILGLLRGGIDVAAVDKEAAWLDELSAAAGGKGFAGELRTQITGRRFLAARWDASLPPAEAAEKCGAPIAGARIATIPIEPD